MFLNKSIHCDPSLELSRRDSFNEGSQCMLLYNNKENCPKIILVIPSYLELYDNYIENTMLMSFDIKFIRRDQKQHRNGEACCVSPTCFWLSLLNGVKSKRCFVRMHHDTNW